MIHKYINADICSNYDDTIIAHTVRVENFEGVKFRAFQYSVLFGKFRGY